jgi:hypothetical protein
VLPAYTTNFIEFLRIPAEVHRSLTLHGRQILSSCNPYQSPREYDLSSKFEGPTFLTASMALRSRKVVQRFAIFNIAWPFVAGIVTDDIWLDFVSAALAVRATAIGRTSFRSFPWSSLVCGLYAILFVFDCFQVPILDLGTWIARRNSPVLFLRMVSGVWGAYAAACILRCYFTHRKLRSGRDREGEYAPVHSGAEN